MRFENHEEDRTHSFAQLSKDTEVGHYRIIEKIGAGGMGEVYLATDTDLDRKVALKFLPQHLLADETAKKRFKREAHAVAKLNHPNIVTIHEVSDYNGRPFFAMEYLPGKTLDRKIKQSPLTADSAISITVEIARGLLTAHENGVIHRDIKPANISVADDGTVKILDFGLAQLSDAANITGSNVVLGTVGYNSPEQIAGEHVDKRADIWSLGVVLYKMLSQQLPFKGDDPHSIMYSIRHDEPMDIFQTGADIPKSVQKLYKRCLEKDKDKRPQSMSEVLELLGTRRSPPEISSRTWSRRRKRRLLWLLAGLIFAVAVVLAGYLYISTSAPPKQGEWRVGILPFRNDTSDSALSDWPAIIQALFVSSLTGIQEIGVVDPLSLNTLIQSTFDTSDPPRESKLYGIIRGADISYLIDGTIIKAGEKYLIQSNLTEPALGEVLFSYETTINEETNLPRVVDTLSQHILDYFQTKILQVGYVKDLRPWLSHRTQHLGAFKAFMQANQFIFNGMPGSEKYLRRAIELDSTFVAPRIWLISGLMHHGRIGEANELYRTLLKHESEANPFEQAMISWAGAYLAGDARLQAKALQLALHYSPGNNILLYVLARIKYTLDDYKGAIEVLQPAVDMKWRHSPAYYLIGASHCMLRQYAQARKILEQSLAITPVYPYTYGLLSGLTFEKGDNIKAQEYENLYIKELRETGGQLGYIYAMLARSHLSMDFNDNAVRCYELAVLNEPNNPDYYDEMGEALYYIEDYDAARDAYVKALELDSLRINAHKMLGFICDIVGDTDNAIYHYEVYLKQDSTSISAAEVSDSLSELKR